MAHGKGMSRPASETVRRVAAPKVDDVRDTAGPHVVRITADVRDSTTPTAPVADRPTAWGVSPTTPRRECSSILDGATTTEFRAMAELGAFAPHMIPPYIRPDSRNGGLALGSFTPIRYAWAADQRGGIFRQKSDSFSFIDHTIKAADIDFFLANDAPLPDEIRASSRFIATVGRVKARNFRTDQLMGRLISPARRCRFRLRGPLVSRRA